VTEDDAFPVTDERNRPRIRRLHSWPLGAAAGWMRGTHPIVVAIAIAFRERLTVFGLGKGIVDSQ
jgi:hypothetical protein